MLQTNPEHDCPLCPRLVAYRRENQQQFPDWFNAPVPQWGDHEPSLIIVGLAPGVRGANRTGRPFTGDYAGDLLYATMSKFGFASGEYLADPNDGLELRDAMIVNAVRCVPPQNKPTGAEIKTCRQFLSATLTVNTKAKAYLALGRIAHESFLRTLGLKLADCSFAHGAEHMLPDGRILFDSYHCSRYNTNTGRLTEAMFEAVFARIRQTIDGN